MVSVSEEDDFLDGDNGSRVVVRWRLLLSSRGRNPVQVPPASISTVAAAKPVIILVFCLIRTRWGTGVWRLFALV